eukprot:3653202-Rhodomonas_salina.1
MPLLPSVAMLLSPTAWQLVFLLVPILGEECLRVGNTRATSYRLELDCLQSTPLISSFLVSTLPPPAPAALLLFPYPPWRAEYLASRAVRLPGCGKACVSPGHSKPTTASHHRGRQAEAQATCAGDLHVVQEKDIERHVLEELQSTSDGLCTGRTCRRGARRREREGKGTDRHR